MNTIEKKAVIFGGDVTLKITFTNDFPVYNGNIPVEFCALIENDEQALEALFKNPTEPQLAFTKLAKGLFSRLFNLDLVSYDLGVFESDPATGVHFHGVAYLKGEGLKDKIEEVRLNLNADAVARLCAEAGINLSA